MSGVLKFLQRSKAEYLANVAVVIVGVAMMNLQVHFPTMVSGELVGVSILAAMVIAGVTTALSQIDNPFSNVYVAVVGMMAAFSMSGAQEKLIAGVGPAGLRYYAVMMIGAVYVYTLADMIVRAGWSISEAYRNGIEPGTMRRFAILVLLCWLFDMMISFSGMLV